MSSDFFSSMAGLLKSSAISVVADELIYSRAPSSWVSQNCQIEDYKVNSKGFKNNSMLQASTIPLPLL